jgi:hypothetical protein
VLHTDPPQIYAAESVEVLHRVIAKEIVAQTPAGFFTPAVLGELRSALLDEQWGKAAELWILNYSGEKLDVYHDGLVVWTEDMIAADTATLELQFTPLFEDGDD